MNRFIKELLNKNGLMQKDLAQILGISPSAVNQWGSVENISPELLYRLSKLFCISIDNLLEEKLEGETFDEKLERLYHLSENSFVQVVHGGNREDVLRFSQKLRNINERMYELLYLKMIREITIEEKRELDYINEYIRVDIYKSPCFYETFYWNDDRDLEIAEVIKKYIDINNKAEFIWELKKIYYCSKKIERNYIAWELGEFSNEIMENILLSLPEIERNRFVTEYQNDCRIEWGDFINAGIVHILYTRKDFDIPNFTFEELDECEGEKILVLELTEAHNILHKMIGDEYSLSYAEYQKLIYYKKERELVYRKYRTKNPIKYWEFFKKELY